MVNNVKSYYDKYFNTLSLVGRIPVNEAKMIYILSFIRSYIRHNSRTMTLEDYRYINKIIDRFVECSCLIDTQFNISDFTRPTPTTSTPPDESMYITLNRDMDEGIVKGYTDFIFFNFLYNLNVNSNMKVDFNSQFPVFRGNYSNNTLYTYLDVVFYKGSSYILLVESSAGIAPDDTTNWNLVARGAESLEMTTEQLDEITNKVHETLSTDGFVRDPDYIHTDHNFTTELKDKLETISEYANSGVIRLTETEFNSLGLKSNTTFYIVTDTADTILSIYIGSTLIIRSEPGGGISNTTLPCNLPLIF